MAMAGYIIGMQKIASRASPKQRVVEQGFLECFQDDGLERKLSVRRISIDKRPSVDRTDQISDGGLRSNCALGSSRRTHRFSIISGCQQQKKSPGSVERESRPFFWVQHWVQGLGCVTR